MKLRKWALIVCGLWLAVIGGMVFMLMPGQIDAIPHGNDMKWFRACERPDRYRAIPGMLGLESLGQDMVIRDISCTKLANMDRQDVVSNLGVPDTVSESENWVGYYVGRIGYAKAARWERWFFGEWFSGSTMYVIFDSETGKVEKVVISS